MTKLFMALLALPLLACAPLHRPVPLQAIQPEPVVYPMVAVPKPVPMKMQSVRWQVLNSDDLVKLAKENETNEDFVIIALTPEGYKALSGNMLEVHRYIREQKNVIVFLKKTLDDRSQGF